MSFEKKNFSDIYAAMAAEARTRVPELSDYEAGSVIRSLLESFSVEMAILYEQMDLVYQSGFVDTAAGPHLDRVVAVLGLTRNEPDFATGIVTFQRDPGPQGPLTIPLGTLLTTEEDNTQTPSKKAYVTIEDGGLGPNDISVDVRIQAVERGREMAGDSASVVVMPRPVPGIKSVTNKKPILFLGRDQETDAELRQRAKNALLASGQASTTSIETALLSMPGVRQVRVKEDFSVDAGAGQTQPRYGAIDVFVDGLDSKNQPALRDRLDQVRAAGVYVNLKPAVPVSLELVLQIDVDARLSDEERTHLENTVQDAVETYIDELAMGESLLFSQLTSAVLKVSGVKDLVNYVIRAFRETNTNAAGTVTVSRTRNLTENIQIPANFLVQTAFGQQYQTTADVQLVENTKKVVAAVRSVVTGRAGELVRTGSAINWLPLTIGPTEYKVSNAAPILLPYDNFTPDKKRIDVQIMERFVPESVRAASRIWPLPVRVQLQVADSGPDPKAARQKIEGAVLDFFNKLKVGQTLMKSDLETVIDGLGIGQFQLRLVAFPVQSQGPQDDFEIDASFVEQAVPENIFVYQNAVYLTGNVRLALSLTASDEEKSAACAAVRQSIQDYLDSLTPESDIDLKQIQKIASSSSQVLRIEFQMDQCGLNDENGNTLDNRNQNGSVSIGPFEKAFLSDALFIIQA